jgi:probable phosphomutase (TIGR03848 family)
VATVLLLRHGTTTTNLHGTLAGHQPVGLDPLGVRQARALRERFAGAQLPLAAAVTSPLIRCLETLKLALPDLSPTVDDRLVECGYGDWTGRRLVHLAEEPLWGVVQAHPAAAIFPGPDGESIASMSARAVAAVREWDATITRRHGERAIWLACSHGDVIKAVVADALGMHLDLFQRIVVEPASVTAIRYTAVRPFLLRLNDVGDDLGLISQFAHPVRQLSQNAGFAHCAESDAAVGGGAGGHS